MFSIRKIFMAQPASLSPVSDLLRPRSLRLRLMLWYSAFLALALVFFVILVWNFTTNGLSESVDSSVRAEARVAELALNHRLSTTPPYWPEGQLSLQVVDTYQEPGVVVIVLDRQGHIRYNSGLSDTSRLPLNTNTIRATLAGQTTWSTVDIGNRRVRVEALPVRAPIASANGEVTDAAATGPVIGTLLVAKSLDEMDATLLLLRTLLISAGLITLVGVLLGGWVVANRVLQPLAEMAKTARAIAAATAQGTRIGNLSRRVRRPGGRDEMAQVVDTFNEMLTNLEKAVQTQHRFIADASHELRAPLTTVQGNLAFLKRHMNELPAEEQQTMLSDAHSETLRLAQLVDELLLLARADANTDRLPTFSGQEKMVDNDAHQQLIELDHTVLQLVRQLRRRASVEASKLKLEVGHIEPIRVRGDEESIRRILLILLDNALKYTLPTGEKDAAGKVTVSLERQGKEAVLRVRDTGIGIDPDDLPHIFERFYRADRARSREGTGLGLAIAQMLVEQLDGRITAESKPGQGSIFSVWFPLV